MNKIKRRDFLKFTAATSTAFAFPDSVYSQPQQLMAKRAIPSTGQEMGTVSFGNTYVFHQENQEYAETTRELIRILLEYGGNFIDTNLATIWKFEERLDKETLKRLRIVTSFTESETLNVIDMDRVHEALQKKPLDFLQARNARSVRSMRENWPVLKELKQAGVVRNIGITSGGLEQYAAIEKVMREDIPDFIQLDYSLMTNISEQRMLPLAQEKGIGIIVNRPFRNGRFFSIVKGKTLPDWASEFDCESWAQFSVKWTLGHPAVTSVLTETSKPHHARDNLAAGIGKLPDREMRKRMLDLFQSF